MRFSLFGLSGTWKDKENRRLMYDITPPAVFVSDRVLDDEERVQRLHDFLKATNAPDWEVVKDEDIVN